MIGKKEWVEWDFIGLSEKIENSIVMIYQPEKYSIHDFGERTVRVVKAKGTWFYCVSDLSKAMMIARPRNIVSRLGSSESLKINFDGCAYRCVSASGLLAIVPQIFERAKARQQVVDMIVLYSDKV